MPHPPVHTRFDSISSLSEAVSRGELGAHDIATEALDHIRRPQAQDLFTGIDPDVALAQARAMDTHPAPTASRRPLAGVPVAVEDRLVTRAWHSTAGSRMLENYRSPFDATPVADLEQAGALILGKLTCAEFAADSCSEHTLFAAAGNPWNPRCSAGGSAVAAAVAHAVVTGAIGVDTGGALRAAAALCGVSALRPSFGRISRHGIIAAVSSMDQVSVAARRAEDLLELLDPLCHFDPQDGISLEDAGPVANQPGAVRDAWQAAHERMQANGGTPLQGLRIGVLARDQAGLAAPVADALETALQTLEALGAQRVAITLPHEAQAVPAYQLIAAAETASNLSRYDGVHFGFRAPEYGDVHDMIARSRAQGFGAEVIHRILLGTRVLSHGHYQTHCLTAQRLRQRLSEDWQRTLTEQCDVVLRPALPDVAAPRDARPPLAARWQADRYLVGASLAGLPALVLPCGFSPDALPVGLQLVGKRFAEGQLLAMAARFQTATRWHLTQPELQ